MDKVSQVRRNCDLYTAKMVKADTPSESCLVEIVQRTRHIGNVPTYGVRGEHRIRDACSSIKGLTVTYHLHKAQSVNVEPLYLCLLLGRLTSLQVNEVE